MSYIGIPPFGQTVRTVTTITATASQTVFTPNGGYTIGYVDVYYNGIKLVGGADFTATNGTTVTLTAGATANAVIELVAYGSVSIADAVRRSGDTFAGAVNFPNNNIIAANGFVGIGNTIPNAPLVIGSASGSFTNPLVQAASSANSWVQINAQNLNNGNNASTDLVLARSDGTDTSGFIDIGINSNTYQQAAYSIMSPRSGYVFTNGGDLSLGTQTNNAIIFHTGNTTSASERMRITSNGVAFPDGTQFNSAIAFGMRNRIINGAMIFDQRNVGVSSNTSVLQGSTYTLDRWAYYNDVASKRSIQQVTTAPPGFKNSLKVTVLATDTVGPQQYLSQCIEGNNVADLGWGTSAAQTVTLSFWVRSSVVGQHGGTLQNATSARSYPFAYTINVADTWEYKTIVVPGDTTGTWVTDNGIGIRVMFEHGVGYQKSAAAAWVALNSTSSTGSVNLCATSGATWYITGVQLERGSIATPFDWRPIGAELANCSRYYYRFDASVSMYGITAPYNSGNWWVMIPFPVRMRATPTVSATYTGGTMNPYITSDRAHFQATAQSIYVDTLAVSAEL